MPEDGGTISLQTFGRLLPNCMMSKTQNFHGRENHRSSCIHQLMGPCAIVKEYVRTDGGNEGGCPIISC